MNLSRLTLVALALVGWFGLGLQLVLLVNVALGAGTPLLTALNNYFSYFTILTNILVAMSLTARLVAPRSALAAFFDRPGVEAAVTLYIIVVGVVYVLVLQSLWQPQGAQLVADIILHYVTPIGMALRWLTLVPHGGTEARAVPGWLLYPAAYALYALIRGALVGRYPYPFIDAGALGYPRTLLNVGLLVVAFVIAGLAVTALDRWLAQRRTLTAAKSA